MYRVLDISLLGGTDFTFLEDRKIATLSELAQRVGKSPTGV